jgi:hypothetical protein
MQAIKVTGAAKFTARTEESEDFEKEVNGIGKTGYMNNVVLEVVNY